MGIYIPNKAKPKNCWVCFNDDCNHWGENGYDNSDDCPLEEIEIVRCGECKYAKYRIENIEYDKCIITQLFVNKNDFCSYGEPRESEYVAKD